MTQVILQPAGQDDAQEHYRDTIERPVPFSTLEEHLSPSMMSELQATYDDRGVPTWGVTPGKNNVNSKKWQRIEPGDRVLVSKAGGIFATGVVTAKTHNADLARELWNENEDGETWEYVYFINDMEDLQVPYETFNRVVGYKPNAIIMGFNVLDIDKSRAALQAFIGVGSMDEEADQEALEAAEAAMETRRSGQGFAGSPEARKAVEALAMRCAETHFRLKGYEVIDRSSNQPFDLECSRGGEQVLVEVKGTTTPGDQVLLTKNEVALAQDSDTETVLFIQHSVELDREGKGYRASGGHSRIVDPWRPEDNQLTAITYRCQL